MNLRKTYRSMNLVMMIAALFMLSACGATVKIQNVDFASPIEVVAQPDSDGKVSDPRTGLSFNVNPLRDFERRNNPNITVSEVRFIRSHDGFYFVTAPGFVNVYVMQPREGELRSVKHIKINENGIQSPAFNQRNPVIQLLDGTGRSYDLTKDGII
jgi:hypothetical protein